MDLELFRQWPILVLVIVIVGPLLKIIQALYERIASEAIAIRDQRITELRTQLDKQTSAFDRISDALEALATELRRRTTRDGA